MRTFFDQLSGTYTEFYNTSEYLAVDDTVLFKGRVIFKQYIPKKQNSVTCNRIYIHCENLLGKEHAKCNMDDSYTC